MLTNKTQKNITRHDYDSIDFVGSAIYLVAVPAIAYAAGHYVGASAAGGFLGASLTALKRNYNTLMNQFVASALSDPYLTEELPKADFRPKQFRYQ